MGKISTLWLYSHPGDQVALVLLVLLYNSVERPRTSESQEGMCTTTQFSKGAIVVMHTSIIVESVPGIVIEVVKRFRQM